jgi:cytochrome P450
MNHIPDAPSITARTDAEAEKIFFGLMMSPPDDPFPLYAELRQAAPALITSDGSTLVLSTHAECDAALRNRSFGKGDEWLRFQMRDDIPQDTLRPVMERMQRSMILANPPEHTRLRRIVSSAFTFRHVEALRPAVQRRTDELLDALAAAPGSDFMATLAMPLPVNVIGDLLGIPEADRPEITPAIHEMGLLIEPASGPDEIVRGARAENELATYLAALITDKRANPADDLLSRLTIAETDDKLDETETIATAILLFAGGNKPTANMLGNGLQALMDNPGEFQRIREDRDLVTSAVDEMLRYDAPAHVDGISVLEATVFLGADMTPGQTVISLLGAANRDPDRFPDPDRFDVGRTDNPHLSFAAGLHYCLGGPLARLEGQIFLDRLLDRFSGAEAAGTPRRPAGLGHHGFDYLPVALQA